MRAGVPARGSTPGVCCITPAVELRPAWWGAGVLACWSVYVTAVSLVTGHPSPALADEVHLANGDRLSGRVLSQDDQAVVLEHDALGTITLDRTRVASVALSEPAEAPQPAARAWKRRFALGASLSEGNTEQGELSAKLRANGKTDRDELTAAAEGYLSQRDGQTNARRYAGSFRYAFSFGRELAWYNFYKVEADHNRFANIDWRLTSSVGFGYWFSEEPPLMAMAEIGFGWERTRFRDGVTDDSEPVLIPRGFLEKSFSTGAALSQEVTLWPQVGEDAGAVRLKVETVFTNPIRDGLSLRMRFVDEFNSDPAGSAERNDVRLSSELAWDF